MAMLLGLSGCSATPKVVTLTKPPCQVPAWPEDVVVGDVIPGCPDDQVCFTLQETADIINWVIQAVAYHTAVKACDGVEEVPAPPPVRPE